MRLTTYLIIFSIIIFKRSSTKLKTQDDGLQTKNKEDFYSKELFLEHFDYLKSNIDYYFSNYEISQKTFEEMNPKDKDTMFKMEWNYKDGQYKNLIFSTNFFCIKKTGSCTWKIKIKEYTKEIKFEQIDLNELYIQIPVIAAYINEKNSFNEYWNNKKMSILTIPDIKNKFNSFFNSKDKFSFNNSELVQDNNSLYYMKYTLYSDEAVLGFLEVKYVYEDSQEILEQKHLYSNYNIHIGLNIVVDNEPKSEWKTFSAIYESQEEVNDQFNFFKKMIDSSNHINNLIELKENIVEFYKSKGVNIYRSRIEASKYDMNYIFKMENQEYNFYFISSVDQEITIFHMMTDYVGNGFQNPFFNQKFRRITKNSLYKLLEENNMHKLFLSCKQNYFNMFEDAHKEIEEYIKENNIKHTFKNLTFSSTTGGNGLNNLITNHYTLDKKSNNSISITYKTDTQNNPEKIVYIDINSVENKFILQEKIKIAICSQESVNASIIIFKNAYLDYLKTKIV